jgi:argininosuccinate lyase
MAFNPDGFTASRNHTGGTAPEQVREAAATARARLGGER